MSIREDVEETLDRFGTPLLTNSQPSHTSAEIKAALDEAQTAATHLAEAVKRHHDATMSLYRFVHGSREDRRMLLAMWDRNTEWLTRQDKAVDWRMNALFHPQHEHAQWILKRLESLRATQEAE